MISLNHCLTDKSFQYCVRLMHIMGANRQKPFVLFPYIVKIVVNFYKFDSIEDKLKRDYSISLHTMDDLCQLFFNIWTLLLSQVQVLFENPPFDSKGNPSLFKLWRDWNYSIRKYFFKLIGTAHKLPSIEEITQVHYNKLPKHSRSSNREDLLIDRHQSFASSACTFKLFTMIFYIHQHREGEWRY